MFPLQLTGFFPKELNGPGQLFLKSSPLQDGKECISRRAGYLVSSQRKQMSRSRKRIHDVSPCHKSPQREPSDNRLSHNDTIGDDTIVFDGKKLACPVKALLYFFRNK